MTVGFGHGVAEPPLAIVRGTAATVNGGILVTPTLLDQEDPDPPEPDTSPAEQFQQGVQNAALSQTLPPPPTGMGTGAPMPEAPITPQGVRVLSESNSALLRRLLRLDVTQGTGRTAESAGYFVGGKTGTAEKIGPHGGYLKHVNISAFTSIFPMNAPRYAVYIMLDSPQPTPQTHGWTTAGWNAAPTVSRVISRIGPMLQVFPDVEHAAQIDAQLAIPMHPAVPRGVRPLGPGNDPGDPRKLEAEHRATKQAARQALEPGPHTLAIRKKTAGENMDE